MVFSVPYLPPISPIRGDRAEIGNVENKNVVLVDDMVDTAGTLVQAANLMLEKGAVSVRAICTHAIFSKNAIDKIEKSKLKELIVTDSINHSITRNSKIKVLTKYSGEQDRS